MKSNIWETTNVRFYNKPSKPSPIPPPSPEWTTLDHPVQPLLCHRGVIHVVSSRTDANCHHGSYIRTMPLCSSFIINTETSSPRGSIQSRKKHSRFRNIFGWSRMFISTKSLFWGLSQNIDQYIDHTENLQKSQTSVKVSFTGKSLSPKNLEFRPILTPQQAKGHSITLYTF